MRLFTGIDLPETIRERLDVLVSRLRATAHVKWSPIYNLHITTKFIGEWPRERLDELAAKLKSVMVEQPVEIGIQGLGWFPNARNPHTLWAGVRAAQSLAGLAEATDRACSEIGIARENRPYSPHLTLARIKPATPLGPLRKAVGEIHPVDFGAFRAPGFYLYLSEPGPSGSIYTPLYDFPLPSA